jgi:hypothetical protein
MIEMQMPFLSLVRSLLIEIVWGVTDLARLCVLHRGSTVVAVAVPQTHYSRIALHAQA